MRRVPLLLLLACRHKDAAHSGAHDSTTDSSHESSGDSSTGDVGPLLIIGGGPSGLACAGAAGQGTLYESTPFLGGRAPAGGNVVMVVDSEEQEAAGIADTVDAAVADWPSLTGAAATDETVAYLTDSRATRDRLAALGVTFELFSRQDPILHKQRLISVSRTTPIGIGGALMAALPSGVTVLASTPVQSVDVEDGRVVGVEVNGERVPAGTVVVATGGFSGNPALFDPEVQTRTGLWAASDVPGATGDALTWANAGGWSSSHLDAIGWYFGTIGILDSANLPLHVGINWDAEPFVIPWIWVDPAGGRYVDETGIWSLSLSRPLDGHAGSWAIIPRDELVAAVSAPDLATLDAAAGSGSFACDDTVAGLATALGVDGVGLQATIDTIEAERAGTALDPVNRDPQSLVPFAGRALCGFLPARIGEKSYGGIDVAMDGHVLDASGSPIAGLYAVGEAAGMGAPGMGGLTGFDGSIGAVVWSGWRVGDALNGLGAP